MLIPVCHLIKFGAIIGTVYFNTDTLKFIDKFDIADRDLPIQNYLDCSLDVNNKCTVVGKNYSCNTFIVCFGDSYIFEVNKDLLLRYKVSNIKVTKNNRFICTDGKLPDLGYLFPNRDLMFNSMLIDIQASSLGVAKKFYATYKGSPCVVKFSKVSSNADLINEEKYYKVSKLLGVPCCEAYVISYGGRYCCISVFKYSKKTDVFKSFKSSGKSITELYDNFCDYDKNMFNSMMILDYIMSQQDRHMSNIALCNDRLYPLFDNGECLGLGSISYFSDNFRKYVLSLDRGYIKCLFRLDITVLNKMRGIIGDNIFNSIVKRNLEELGLWR